MLIPKFQNESLAYHEALMHLPNLLKYVQFLMLLPHLYEMFLKNSKPLWKHVLSNTIFMILQIVYTKREQEAFFKRSLVRTKSQST